MIISDNLIRNLFIKKGKLISIPNRFNSQKAGFMPLCLKMAEILRTILIILNDIFYMALLLIHLNMQVINIYHSKKLSHIFMLRFIYNIVQHRNSMLFKIKFYNINLHFLKFRNTWRTKYTVCDFFFLYELERMFKFVLSC